jgi:hypothetical protein
METKIKEWGNGQNVCDWSHDTRGEIRRLPTGGGANLLCHKHYLQEMTYRREMVNNGTWNKDDTMFPSWDSLEIYAEAE